MLVASFALLVRGGVIFSSLEQLDADPDAYRVIAESISQHNVFGLPRDGQPPKPTAYRPPLYPYLLSWLTVNGSLTRSHIAILHLVLGTLSVVLVYQTAQSLFQPSSSDEPSTFSEPVRLNSYAVVAAALVAVDPILLRHSQLVMTETLATTLVAAILWVWSRWNPEPISTDGSAKTSWVWPASSLGALLAGAYLCRPTFLVWAGGIVLIVLLSNWKRTHSGLTAAKQAAPIVLFVAIAVGFWTLRNVRVMGHPIWATSHGGYTLLLGNNELFYDYLEQGQFGRAWDAVPFLEAYQHRYDGDPNQKAFWNKDWSGPRLNRFPVTEHADDRKSYDAAIATIRRRPRAFLWASLVKMARVFSPLPHDRAVDSSFATMAIGVFYVAIYLAVVVAIYRQGKRLFSREYLPMWALLITLMIVHSFYWSNMRMRAPAVPAISLLAASCLLPRATRHSNQTVQKPSDG